MSLDFYVEGAGKDSGQNNAASISPISNGEGVNGTVATRPAENLRARTEVLRRDLDLLHQEVGADRGLILRPVDPAVRINVLNNSGYYFTLTGGAAAMIIEGGTSVGAAIRAKYTSVAYGGGNLVLTSKSGIKASQGANNLYILIERGESINLGSNHCVVSVLGASTPPVVGDLATGPITIRVELERDVDGTQATIAQVVAAITASTDASVFVDATYATSYTGTVSPISRIAFNDKNAPTGSMGAVDESSYKIGAAALATVFGAAKMAHGDLLVLDFDTAENRLANTSGSFIADSLIRIVSADSVNSSNRHTIPICKADTTLGGLVFFNGGGFIPIGVSSFVGNDPRDLRTELAAQADNYGDELIGAEAKDGGVFDLAAGTVKSQLLSIVSQLSSVSPQGANLVGVAALERGTRDIAQGSVGTALADIYDYYNDHIEGTADKHAVAAVTNKPFVTVNATAGLGDYQTLAAAITALKDLGGVIYVSGTLSLADSISADDITKPIIVFGSSRDTLAAGTAIIQPSSAGTPAISFSGAGILNSTLTFQNIKFNSLYTNTPVVRVTSGITTTNNDSVNAAGLHFIRCEFRCTTASVAGYFIETNAHVSLVDSFVFSSEDTATLRLLKVDSDYISVPQHSRIRGCSFLGTGFDGIARIGSGGAGSTTEYNVVFECSECVGEISGGNTGTGLFEIDMPVVGSYYVLFDVYHNSIRNYRGNIVKATGYAVWGGRISDNQFSNWGTNLTDSDVLMAGVAPTTSVSFMQVMNNRISLATASRPLAIALFTDTKYLIFTGNTITGFKPTGSYSTGITITDTTASPNIRITNNYFGVDYSATADTTSFISLLFTASATVYGNVQINENTIAVSAMPTAMGVGLHAGVQVIHSGTEIIYGCSIRDNLITFPTDNTSNNVWDGILITNIVQGSIRGNNLRGVHRGIYAVCSRSVISDNTIQLHSYASASVRGIFMDDSTYNIVNGNFVSAQDAVHHYGIVFNGVSTVNNACCGNNIIGTSTARAIAELSASDNGIGVVGSSPSLLHNLLPS